MCETRDGSELQIPSVEEIAEAMIANSDYGDICGHDHVIYDSRPASRETCCLCRYHVSMNAETGALWVLGDDPADQVMLTVDAEIGEEVLAVYDEPDGEDDETDWPLKQMIEEARVDDFQKRFDDWEGLHSPGFYRAAEELQEQMLEYFS